jgi:hypothetical protein
MRTSILTIATTMLLAIPAFADEPQNSSKTPGNNAVNTTSTPQPAMPVEGANSFTEGQAKSRFEEKGFSDVSELKKDNTGIWRGRAQKDGKTVSVSLDFQGNVFAN